jgi:nucleotide-binding universal stress UspA family protein
MQKILVPVDFSELSDYAMSIAGEIATSFDSEIILLNVIHVGKDAIFDNKGNLSDSNDFDVAAIKKQQVENESKLAELTKNFKNARAVVKVADIEEAILECDKQENINLIVMGTHGSSGLAQQISGTIADKIIRLAKASVITLKCKRETTEFKKILLVSDFNPPVKDNIKELLELVGAFGAELHLLKVNTTFNKENKDEVEARMEVYCDLNGIENAAFHVFDAASVEAGIEAFTDREGIEFVAIGSRGRMGISAFFQGCISADLVNHLYKPVFTFRA